MNIESLHQVYSQNYLVDTDTRKIREKSVFFALKGENFNGNHYAVEALNKGASYAVVDEYVADDPRLILVEDVLETLQELASFHRKKLSIPIIALTGSNGKTTTKELINAVLLKKYNTNATKGNLNNHIGVPLTLLSMDKNTEIGIVEMGANHHEEIAFLSAIVNPDYGYITNFGKAHLEGFGSIEGVIEAKSELYTHLINTGKTIFVNQNDPIQMDKTSNANRILLDSTVSIKEVNPLVRLNYGLVDVNSNLIGEYNFPNILVAISMGIHFGVNKKDIINAIQDYVPKNNRSQVINVSTNKIILDAYNANPTSMEAAIINFNGIEALNKTLILGDMFELGNDSAKEHQNIVSLLERCNFKDVFLIGENFNKTKTNYYKFGDFKTFSKYFENQALDNCHILIKGSRGMRLERILDFIN